MKPTSALSLLSLSLAVILAVLPLPSAAVEGWYSQGVYAWMQGWITPLVNLVPFALFDLALAAAVVAVVWSVVARVRRRGWVRGLLRSAWTLLVAASIVYLVFLAMWGFNYRRVPLETRLDYDPGRITFDAARALAMAAVAEVNEGRRAAVRAPFDEASLARAFAATQQALGDPRPAATGRPKASMLGIYFRRAAIDGMTNPFMLEIILNPDLLPAERPMVLAHEWAHLAGYAHETEANFVAWLACLQGDAAARYSAWLSAYEHAARALPRDERARLPPLEEGPREDLRAIAARYRRSSPVVRTAARDVYDSYLRAHRVHEGVASYGAVVRLMLGAARDEDERPRLRAP
jgi:hypothetical protein